VKKAELLAEQERLLKRANELAQLHWGVDYTGTLRLLTRKWARREAAFAFMTDGSVQEIRMSAPTNERLTPEQIEANLLHELVHWRLWSLGLTFGDEDREFVAEAIRVGAAISHAKRAREAYERYLEEAGVIAA
jgi:SprT-like protein